jgi:hypothetical protein
VLGRIKRQPSTSRDGSGRELAANVPLSSKDARALAEERRRRREGQVLLEAALGDVIRMKNSNPRLAWSLLLALLPHVTLFSATSVDHRLLSTYSFIHLHPLPVAAAFR